jgi:two-component system response regulator YesN
MNVLVVDDEPIVRRGLRSLVDWEKHGLHLVGEASDGVEAWDLLQTEPVDILVTDILMPRMDGLELIRRLKQADSQVGVLVLSCLDDFSYVKEAMKLGAQDYVLKPTMEPEELISNILEIRSELLSKREASRQVEQWKQQVEQTKQMQLALRIQSYLDGGQADAKLQDDLFPRGSGLYSLMVYGAPAAKIPIWEWNTADVLASVKWMNNRMLLLYPVDAYISTQELYSRCFAQAQQMDKRIRGLLGEEEQASPYFLCIGSLMNQLGDLKQLLTYHERQADYRFYQSRSRIVGVVPPQRAREEAAALPYDSRNDLLRALQHHNREAMLHCAEQLAASFKEQQPGVAKLQAFVLELLGWAVGYAREQGYSRMDDYEERYVSLETVQSRLSVDELCEWLREAVRELWEYRRGPVFDALPANPFLRKALRYMLENYNRNLSTVDIAEHVRLSRSYLSDLYSREMGESLSETLTRIRMNEAKRMLRNGELKIYEVAEAVGFADSKAFTKTFKRIVGCTPKEFDAQNK